MTACAPAATETPSPAGEIFSNRPVVFAPPFTGAILKTYLDPGFVAVEDGWSIRAIGFTSDKTQVQFELCYLPYGDRNCTFQYVPVDHQGIAPYFLRPAKAYFLVNGTTTTGDPNVEVWGAREWPVVAQVYTPPTTVVSATTPVPTIDPASNVTLLPEVVGLSLEELKQGHWYQRCEDICRRGQFFKNPDRFEMLDGSTVPYNENDLILRMLDETEIVIGETYYICAMPGNQVYVNDVLMVEGDCVIGVFEGIKEGYVDGAKQGWYEYTAPGGETMRMDWFTGAFEVFKTLE